MINNSHITTAELQKLINGGGRIDLTGHTVIVDDHVWLHGDAQIIGGSIIITRRPTYGHYVFVAGGKHYGSDQHNGGGVAWTGTLQGVSFVTTPDIVGDEKFRIVSMMFVEDVGIYGCTFDTTASPGVPIGCVSAMNNHRFVNPARRRGITITVNRVRVHQLARGCEGISVNHASRVVMSNNSVYGVGDDAFALHQVDDFLISHNRAEVIDGRIYLANSRNGVVEHNRLRRIVPAGGGCLMQVNTEYLQGPRPTNILIQHNTLEHHPMCDKATHGIRLQGVKDCRVLDNRVLAPNRNGLGHGRGIRLEPQQFLGWSDPDGVEPDDMIRLRSVVIRGNDVPDITEGAIGAASNSNPGPVLVGDDNRSQYTKILDRSAKPKGR